ncbi:flagella basal body P-ring formation protein FlgA [Ectothiorhodospira magna]|uniref:Flagella basal body P-ring formation protein FlgA n=1 Tax=Ectothiorhodospira magna TaxID=867345 RepID=A0A1H9DDM8_9GAMM|nr:flagellar basal body P-ring formation chaperone FlgA [Ectothiorhodospira magna]SEQ11672.1 flagella basal body P-ring formation protein FlgA [Ectothiorhodospira magna]
MTPEHRTLQGVARRLLLGCMILCGTGPAMATAIQSHDSILTVASDFLDAQARAHHGDDLVVQVRPGNLDPRLRLQACGAELEAFLTPGTRMIGNTTVGIRCPAPAPWSLFVPMQVNVRGEVVVLERPLPRGALIASGDIRVELRDLGNLHGGYLTNPAEVSNMVLRRGLPAGTVLSPQMVEPQRLVHRGDTVILLAQGGGLSVRMEGLALAHGAYGDRVTVRNLSSRRVVEGRVLSAGVVGVNM